MVLEGIKFELFVQSANFMPEDAMDAIVEIKCKKVLFNICC